MFNTQLTNIRSSASKWLVSRKQPQLFHLSTYIAGKNVAGQHYAGTHNIALSQIRGSLNQGRCRDFDGNFRLRNEQGQTRLASVAQVWQQKSLPPISLVQVDDIYFVQDGHHRVSIALANQQYDRALSLTDRTLSVLEEMGQRVFLPDILRCKGEALFALDRIDEAGKVLAEALAMAENQNSRRAMWPILSVMARHAKHSGDETEAESLRSRARDVIQYIADRAGSPEAGDAYLNSPKVRDLMGDS